MFRIIKYYIFQKIQCNKNYIYFSNLLRHSRLFDNQVNQIFLSFKTRRQNQKLKFSPKSKLKQDKYS